MWEDSEESEKVKSEGDGEGEPKRIPQGQRKGYMGHIIRLSSQVRFCLNTKPSPGQYLRLSLIENV